VHAELEALLQLQTDDDVVDGIVAQMEGDGLRTVVIIHHIPGCSQARLDQIRDFIQVRHAAEGFLGNLD